MLLEDYYSFRSSLTSLWREAFGDEEDFIRLIFETPGFSPIVFASVEAGEAVSALYLIPAVINGLECPLRGYYVYACATLRARRGRGLMNRLIREATEWAKTNGEDFLALVPGEKSLYDYYKGLGFKTAMHNLKGQGSKSATESCDFKELTFDEYFQKRGKISCPHFSLAGGGLRYLEAVLRFEGYTFGKIGLRHFAFDPEGGEILESFNENGKMNGEKAEFGMILPLDEKADGTTDIYMNFAME